jgi:hypothetical protein
MKALRTLYSGGCVFLYVSGALMPNFQYSVIGRQTRDWIQRSRNNVKIKRLIIEPFRELIRENEELRKVLVYGVLEILLGYWKPGFALLL